MSNYYFKIYRKDLDGYMAKVNQLIHASPALSHVETPYPDHIGITVTFANDDDKNSFAESLRKNIGLGMSAGY